MAFFWCLGTSNYYFFLSFRGGSVVKSSTKLLFQRNGVRFPAPRWCLTTVCNSSSRIPVLVKKTNRGGYAVFLDGDKEACTQKPSKPGHTSVQHQAGLQLAGQLSIPSQSTSKALGLKPGYYLSWCVNLNTQNSL